MLTNIPQRILKSSTTRPKADDESFTSPIYIAKGEIKSQPIIDWYTAPSSITEAQIHRISQFTLWMCHIYPELDSVLPPCWIHHPFLIIAMDALRASWVGAYMAKTTLYSGPDYFLRTLEHVIAFIRHFCDTTNISSTSAPHDCSLDMSYSKDLKECPPDRYYTNTFEKKKINQAKAGYAVNEIFEFPSTACMRDDVGAELLLDPSVDFYSCIADLFTQKQDPTPLDPPSSTSWDDPISL